MKRFTLLLAFLAALSITLYAQTPINVLNPASDLSGKTIVTAEGNRTISGVFTYSTPPLFPAGTTGSPGITGSADTTTGWVLSSGSIAGSLAGTQRFLLNASGLAIYGNLFVNNSGNLATPVPAGATDGQLLIGRSSDGKLALATLTAGAGITVTNAASSVTVAAAPLASATCGRLTLTTATPYTTSDVTAATTLFFTPLQSCNTFTVFASGALKGDTLTETSVAIPNTTSTMYDVFAFDNAGAINIETLAWTNDTTRATAITVQNGFLAKSGDATRRYIGSCRTTTVAGQTEDSVLKRYVWNYYNRVDRELKRLEGSSTWTYNSATIHQANAAPANQVEVVIGVSEEPIDLTVQATWTNPTATNVVMIGVGLDSTTTFAGDQSISGVFTTGNNGGTSQSHYTGFSGIGRHFYSWNETVVNSGTAVTFYSNANTSIGGSTVGAAVQSGIVGRVRG